MSWAITWSIRHRENWDSYTWSFKAFESWKRDFLKAYQEKTWQSFRVDVPSSGDREAIYKRVFSMEWIDVFRNEHVNKTKNREIDDTILDTCRWVSDKLIW